jgi:hypothetical protein
VADAHIQQSTAAPVLNVDVDRSRAQYAGMTERDVTTNPAIWPVPATSRRRSG